MDNYYFAVEAAVALAKEVYNVRVSESEVDRWLSQGASIQDAAYFAAGEE